VASAASILLGLKYRLGVLFRVVLCVVVTVILMNVYFQTPLPKGRTGELYEVFWIIPLAITAIVTLWLSKGRK